MSFETSKFGNGVLVGSGGNVTQNVHNHFGSRDSGKTTGVNRTAGAVRELIVDFDGDMVTAEGFPLIAPKLPAKAIIEDAYLEIFEAFVLGGTSPAIDFGTEGSEATNGVTITEAQAEAVGAYDVTSALSGTWAAPLAAETTVGIALSGTTPTVTTAGRGKLVIRYVVVGA